VPSLSHKTIVYKGMLLTGQLEQYFKDLKNPAMETALALVHSRFSTNTFPSWDRAHPYRYIAHNGEINTLRGNINWMHAREALFESDLFGEDMKKILPIVNPNGSDSAMFDNTLELLVLAGPLAGARDDDDDPRAVVQPREHGRRAPAFYQYHSCLMEPWDGPASIAFTDGVQIGAVLDRNGLRPSRYYVTKDGLVIMASEAGVLDMPPENILQKGRLQPGRMFLVDTEQGRIIEDEEIKKTIASEHPYRKWLDEHLVHLRTPGARSAAARPPDAPAAADRLRLHERGRADHPDPDGPRRRRGRRLDGQRRRARGALEPAAPALRLFQAAVRPGHQPPDRLHPRGDHHRRRDPARLRGQPADAPAPSACRRVELKWPILTNEEFAKLRRLNLPGLKVGVLPILFRVTRGEKGLAKSLEELSAWRGA
jgi:hypothetical protein